MNPHKCIILNDSEAVKAIEIGNSIITSYIGSNRTCIASTHDEEISQILNKIINDITFLGFQESDIYLVEVQYKGGGEKNISNLIMSCLRPNNVLVRTRQVVETTTRKDIEISITAQKSSYQYHMHI